MKLVKVGAIVLGFMYQDPAFFANAAEDMIHQEEVQVTSGGLDKVGVTATGKREGRKRITDSAKCEITSKVKSCTVVETGAACIDYIVPMNTCTTNELMTFTFEYCNKEETKIKFQTQKSKALVEKVPVQDLEFFSDLVNNECREFTVTQPINTCKKFFSSSLKVEGWRGDGVAGDYCYAYAFQRIYPKRAVLLGAVLDPIPPTCAVTSNVECFMAGTNDPCENIVVPQDECEDTEMTFEFEYCNLEPNEVNLLGGIKTIAKVENLEIAPGALDLSIMVPDECRTITENRMIDTCKTFFSASLKVEGRRGDNNGDYCYDYDFYRSNIERGVDPIPPTSCVVTSNVKCFITETTVPCDDIVVPQDKCEDTEMTFEFEYCNFEKNDVNLLGGIKTIAKVENLRIAAGALDLSIMVPGECRKITENRMINTCKTFFSASLKVEGRRGDNDGDYCYDYDFYRSNIIRGVDPIPTSCDVTSNVKCFMTETNDPCEDIVVPFEECDAETEMTFEFEYCNFEKNDVNLLGGIKTIAKVENLELIAALNLSIMVPDECRTIRKNIKIDTCKTFFSASLKVEGRRGDNDGDYCYDYDFYRSNIARFRPA